MQNTHSTTISGGWSNITVAHSPIEGSYVMLETLEQRRIRELEEKVAALEEKMDNLWQATSVKDLI